MRLDKKVNNEYGEFVTKNLITEKVYGYSWSALNQTTPTIHLNGRKHNDKC